MSFRSSKAKNRNLMIFRIWIPCQARNENNYPIQTLLLLLVFDYFEPVESDGALASGILNIESGISES